MKKFSIPCDFAGQRAPFDFYIGDPTPHLHPLFFQHLWLRSERGGEVPTTVLDSFTKLENLARENDVSFEELCAYALEQAYKDQDNMKATDAPAETD